MNDIATTPMVDALAWATNETGKAKEPSSNPFVWLWEALEGDFNDERSTAQIMFDAAVSMIPLVDHWSKASSRSSSPLFGTKAERLRSRPWTVP